MLHLAAFGGAKPDSVSFGIVPAVIDNALVTSANAKYLSPGRMKIVAAQAICDSILRARLNAPSLRQEGMPELYPYTVAALQAADPKVWLPLDECPTLKDSEEFGIEMSNGVSTVKNAYGALWLQDVKTPLPGGKRMTIVGTCALTLTAAGWALGSVNLDQTLPVGTYSVIGMACVCANGLFARLVFPRGGMWRPGCPVTETLGGIDPRQNFRAGRLGLWGDFTQTTQPQLEVFGRAAGAVTATVILDLVQRSTNGQ